MYYYFFGGRVYTLKSINESLHMKRLFYFTMFQAHHLTYGVLLVKQPKRIMIFLVKHIKDLIIWLNQFDLIIANPVP